MNTILGHSNCINVAVGGNYEGNICIWLTGGFCSVSVCDGLKLSHILTLFWWICCLIKSLENHQYSARIPVTWTRSQFLRRLHFSTQERSMTEIAENICSEVAAPAKATGVIHYSYTVTWILIKENKCVRCSLRKAVTVIMSPVWDFSQVQIWMAGKRPNVWQLLCIISWRTSCSRQSGVCKWELDSFIMSVCLLALPLLCISHMSTVLIST